MIVTKVGKGPFPTTAIFNAPLAYILVRILRNEFSLCPLAHGFMDLSTYLLTVGALLIPSRLVGYLERLMNAAR